MSDDTIWLLKLTGLVLVGSCIGVLTIFETLFWLQDRIYRDGRKR